MRKKSLADLGHIKMDNMVDRCASLRDLTLNLLDGRRR